MPFKPGLDPNRNSNGRPKGSQNLVSKEIKEAFATVLENRLGDLEAWLERTAETDPAKAAEILIKLSNRFVPELSRQELTGADGEELFKNLKFDFGTEPLEDNKEE